mgnify:FL=1
MSKSFIISFLIWGVVGCTHQMVSKKPPLVPYNQKEWTMVNATDFIPPKAKTYVKVQEIDLEQVKIEPVAGE